jgi:hypothetical protein
MTVIARISRFFAAIDIARSAALHTFTTVHLADPADRA